MRVADWMVGIEGLDDVRDAKWRIGDKLRLDGRRTLINAALILPAVYLTCFSHVGRRGGGGTGGGGWGRCNRECNGCSDMSIQTPYIGMRSLRIKCIHTPVPFQLQIFILDVHVFIEAI